MNKPTVITPPIISNGDSMSFSDIASWGKTPIVGVSIAVFIASSKLFSWCFYNG